MFVQRNYKQIREDYKNKKEGEKNCTSNKYNTSRNKIYININTALTIKYLISSFPFNYLYVLRKRKNKWKGKLVFYLLYISP